MRHALAWQLWRKTTGEWVLSNSDNAGNGRAVELSEVDAAPLIAAMATALANQK